MIIVLRVIVIVLGHSCVNKSGLHLNFRFVCMYLD